MTIWLIKDLMVPVSEYATVPENATMFDALLALEKAEIEFDHSPYRHRGVLVLDEKKKVIGKLGYLDVFSALEPREDAPDEAALLGQFGFTSKFIQKFKKNYRLLDTPLEDLCKRTAKLKVVDFMQAPTPGECLDENANVGAAIHQLITGSLLSLLVTRDKEIVGILRQPDVFAAVFHTMKGCEKALEEEL